MNYGKLIYACAMLTALSIVACGIAYPLASDGLRHGGVPRGAGGSPVNYNGTVVGSLLIGQNFSGPEYFHSRPSAVDYNASASGASNLGPNNPALIAAVQERMSNGSTTCRMPPCPPAPAWTRTSRSITPWHRRPAWLRPTG